MTDLTREFYCEGNPTKDPKINDHYFGQKQSAEGCCTTLYPQIAPAVAEAAILQTSAFQDPSRNQAPTMTSVIKMSCVSATDATTKRRPENQAGASVLSP